MKRAREYSTANPGAAGDRLRHLTMLPNQMISPLFAATVQASEEAIVNSVIAAKTIEGINGNIIFALPHDRLLEALAKYGRLGNSK